MLIEIATSLQVSIFIVVLHDGTCAVLLYFPLLLQGYTTVAGSLLYSLPGMHKRRVAWRWKLLQFNPRVPSVLAR